MFIKKTIILILIVALVFPFNVYSYSETSAVSDFSSDAFSIDEQDVSKDELDFAGANRLDQPGLDDEYTDGVYAENTLTEEPSRATTYSNGIIQIDNTEVVMPENSTVRIVYQILDPSYRIDFWYEGNRNFTMSTTQEELVITSREPEVNLIMVHYINETTGNEGHFYINVNVYPKEGYVYLDNIASGRCLDVRGAYITVGTKTIIYAKNSSIKANQVWKIKPLYDGTVYLQSVLHPDRYLYINPTTLNAEINTKKTAWYFNYNDYSECYRIYSQSSYDSSDLCLGVKDDATAANSEVIVNTSSSTNSKKWNVSRINNYVPVSGVTISSPTTESSFTKTLKNKDYEDVTIKFKANIYPSTATNRAITWSSSDPSIATINEKTGDAELKSVGTVTFFAKANDGTVTDSCRVNVISNFCYIKNYNSNRYFDIANSGTAEGTKLLHWSFNGASNQIMKIVSHDDNTFTIHPLPSMNAMAVTVTEQGVTLQPYDENNNNQKFNIIATQNSFYKCRIMPKGTTNCLTEDDSGNKLITSTPTATDIIELLSQEWTIESYESKALSMLNFAAYSLYPDENYGYLSYNKAISQLTTFALDGNNYKKGACWKFQEFDECNVAYVSKNDLLYLMPYADIVYIDSHAQKDGDIKYKDRTIKDEDRAIKNKEETDATGIIQFSDIGINFIEGETTITNSVFNKKTKWIINSSCSQLDVYGKGTTEGGDNSAYKWAKVMLGEGQRLHGVLGYYNVAPQDDSFVKVLTSFFEAQGKENNTESMITSWMNANTYEHWYGETGSSWAVIFHHDNAEDRLNSMTSSTLSGDQYVIERMYREDTSVDVLNLNTPPKSSNSNSKEIDMDNLITLCLESGGEMYIDDSATIKMRVDSDGSVFYEDTKNVLNRDSYVTSSSKEAAQNSVYALCEMGVIDDINYSANVCEIKKHTLDLENDTATNEVVSGYQITLTPKTNANKTDEINIQKDAIRLIYTNDSISSFMRCGISVYNTEGETK